ncbi:MAG: MotA/TolQ/ExbB proton channel family protein [Verrucomicrobiae bacterium]|nr:MotA/TolQ/ExbB proton channel family protein [Verrucomicrobiae bacterium]
MMQFLRAGGPFMIPLIICSLMSVAIILERGFALRRRRIISQNVADAVDNLPPQGGVDIVWNVVKEDPSVLGRLIRVCLDHLRWPKAENIEALQNKARHEGTRMDRYLVILEIIVGVAPLLGLLGTVSGLVHVFATIGTATETVGVARGIAEALNATIGGLVIAIPSLIAHSYYTKKVENYMIEMENICADLLAKLYKLQGA